MRGFDLVLGLAAVLAVTSATPVHHDGERALPIPTSCPAIDPVDSTVHLQHEVMCSLFYKCQAGEKIVQLCSHQHNHQLLYFNPELQTCDWQANVTCTPRSCVLDANGSPVKAPYDSSCQQHYDCINGELSLRRCPDGMKFDQKMGRCVMDSVAVCGPIKEECDSIYKEPLPESCSFYVICSATRNVVLPCPAGKFFSRPLQDCVDASEADCKAPTMKPYPGNCNLYYQNKDGVKVVESCEKGLHFNALSQKCEAPSDAGCTVAISPAKGHVCSGNSRSPHPTECRLYLECVNGEEEVRICDEGLHFNPFAQVCQPANIAGCDDHEPCPTPTPEPECSGNKKIPYPDECRLYQECVNGFIKTKPCPEGLHFNATLQQCLEPCKARCDPNWNCPPPKPGCTGHEKSPHKTFCYLYRECVNGVIETKMCGGGLHFNPYAKECQEPCEAHCDPTLICPTGTPTPQPECIEGSKLEHICDCGVYYECVNGRKKLRLCEDGLHFNPVAQECQLPNEACCDKNICPTPSPTPTPTPSQTPSQTPSRPTPTQPWCSGTGRSPHHDCRLYRECVDGFVVTRQCEQGLHFNPFVQECQEPCEAGCDPNQVCTPTTPTTPEPTTKRPGCKGNNKSPHENCNWYTECVNGFIVTRQCEQGLHFNPYDQECQEPCVAGCDPNQICTNAPPTTLEPTTKRPDCQGNNKTPDKDCNRYTECVDGSIITKYCDQGLHFNPYDQECQEPCEAGCDKTLPCTTVTPTTIPTPGPVPKCSGNSKAPHKCDCTRYKQCVDGNIIVKYCGEGLHFNKYAQECQTPCEANCDKTLDCTTPTPSPKPECTGNFKSAIPGSCTTYQECVNGKRKITTCPNGLHFNPFALICMEPCLAGCDRDLNCISTTRPPTSPLPEYCVPNLAHPHAECNLYYTCEGGRIITKRCEEGLHFNPLWQICQHPCDAHCDATLQCPEPNPKPKCVGNGKVRHDSDCGLYYECRDGFVQVRSCRKGLHFNTFAQECQSPKNAGCEHNNV